MKPYFYDAKRRCYVVSGSAVQRPTRNAAGMSYTANRGGGRHAATMDPDRITLIVRGTLDRISRLHFRIEKSICPCCGAKTGKLQLNDRGRLHLRTMRRQRTTEVESGR